MSSLEEGFCPSGGTGGEAAPRSPCRMRQVARFHPLGSNGVLSPPDTFWASNQSPRPESWAAVLSGCDQLGIAQVCDLLSFTLLARG